MRIERTCQHCGKVFYTRQQPMRGYPQLFCSRECGFRGRERRTTPSNGPPWTVDSNGCWIWDLPKNPLGYGSFGDSGAAHRWVYHQYKGEIPSHLELDHLCRVPSCVNPDHLEAVTRLVNIQRGAWQKVTPEMAHRIRTSGERVPDLMAALRLSKTTIYRVRRGHR